VQPAQESPQYHGSCLTVDLNFQQSLPLVHATVAFLLAPPKLAFFTLFVMCNRPLSIGGSASRTLAPSLSGNNLAFAAAATVRRGSVGGAKLQRASRVLSTPPDEENDDTPMVAAPVAVSERRTSGTAPVTPTPFNISGVSPVPAPPASNEPPVSGIKVASTRVAGGGLRALKGPAVRCLVTADECDDGAAEPTPVLPKPYAR
jgi:hypothetical protein